MSSRLKDRERKVSCLRKLASAGLLLAIVVDAQMSLCPAGDYFNLLHIVNLVYKQTVFHKCRLKHSLGAKGLEPLNTTNQPRNWGIYDRGAPPVRQGIGPSCCHSSVTHGRCWWLANGDVLTICRITRRQTCMRKACLLKCSLSLVAYTSPIWKGPISTA